MSVHKNKTHMKGSFHGIERVIGVLDRAAVIVAGAMLFVLMLVVVADVAMRYVLGAPIAWSYDVISFFLMPGLFFLAASDTLRANGHVAVDMLHIYLGERARYALEAVSCAVAGVVFAIIAWVSLAKTLEEFQSGINLASGLELPSWSTSFLMPIGFALLTLRAGLETWGYAGSLFSKHALLALPSVGGNEEIAE